MYYAPYLVFLSQLHHQVHIKVVIDDVEIFIDTVSNDNVWRIHTKIYAGYGDIPYSVKECLSSLNLFRWQSQGPFLQSDQERGVVNLVMDCVPMVSFKQFRSTVKQFLDYYSLWREFLVSA